MRSSRVASTLSPARARAFALAVALGVASAWAAPARAQTSGTVDRVTVAEALFDEGRRLMAGGNTKEACAKFAASEQLDHAVGTLLNLADCYQRAGLLASAWSTYRAAGAAASGAGQSERELIARQREAELAAAVSRLRVRVPPVARVDGLEVRLDGTAFGPAAWDLPLPIDPGKHTISASAPGRLSWSRVVDVRTGRAESATETVPTLLHDADAEAPPTGPSARRIAAYAMVIAGAGGIVAGGILGVRALVLDAGTASHCDGNRCDAAGVDQRNSARTSGDAATVAFIAGGVVGAAGVTLLLTEPSRKASSTGQGSMGLSVSGATTGAMVTWRGVF